VLVASIVVSCSGADDARSSDSAATTTTAVASTTTVPSTTSTTTTEPPVIDGPLLEVCPERVVVQTALLPGPDVGPLYELLGPDPQVDVATGSVSGPLVRADGTVEDVVLEIRSGGPAVGFLSPLELMTAVPEILLAQTSTAVALRDAAEFPSLGVITLTDRSRDVLIVDPQTYPEVDSIEAVRDTGIEVHHTTDSAFIAYLAGTGALAADQLVPGFDGEPAAFVQSGGSIAQQGDELVEPVLLPALPQWARPVVSIDAASAGWADHGDALVVRPDDVDARRECLQRLVPVIQEAMAAYVADPQATDVLMSGARSQFAPLARSTAELMDAGVALGVSSGVFGDGTDSTIGNFDVARLEPFLSEFADVVDVAPVPIDELVTNEFIDPTVTSGA